MRNKCLVPALVAMSIVGGTLCTLVGCGGTSVDQPIISNDKEKLTIGMLTIPEYVPNDYSARLAIDEINATGGVNGKLLQLSSRDYNFDTSTALNLINEFMDAGVVGIIGPPTSGALLAAGSQISKNNPIALISPTSNSTRVTNLDDGNTVWRTSISDGLQLPVSVQILLENGFTECAIIADTLPVDYDYAVDFAELFKAKGGKITGFQTIPDGKESGFVAEMQALFAQGDHKAVFLATQPTQGAAVVVDMFTVHPGPVAIFGAQTQYSEVYRRNAPPQAVGTKGTTPTVDTNSPNYQYLNNKILEETGENAYYAAENIYDAVYLMALAMAQSGNNTRQGIVDNLRSVSRADGPDAVVINPGEFAKALEAIKAGKDIDYNGASGRIDWDENGDVTSTSFLFYEMVKGDSGEFQFNTTKIVEFSK